MAAKDLTFEVRKDEIDGGYIAWAPDSSLVTRANSLPELWWLIHDLTHNKLPPDRRPDKIHIVWR